MREKKVPLPADIKSRHKYDSVNVDLVPLCTRIKAADKQSKTNEDNSKIN